MMYRLALYFFRLLAWLPLSVSRGLGRLLGRIAWLAASRMRRTTLTNLRICLPELDEAARERLARESLCQTMQALCETGAVWLWPGERSLQLIREVPGRELLDQAKIGRASCRERV